MMRLRSLLFVPASRPERFGKAVAASADAVVLDLEDAVAPQDKESARDAIRRWASPQRPVMLRINASATPWHAADLELAALPGISTVMLAKAERGDELTALADAGAAAVIPLVETAAGLAAAGELAQQPGVLRLAFGSLDFQLDLGMRDAADEDLYHYRCQLVLASRLAGIGAPIDGVTTALHDTPRLQADVARGRRLGFGGKLCIHPRQVATVNAGFTPSTQDLDWARRVIAAASESALAVVDGKMVDRPVILSARSILRDAGEVDSGE